MSDIKESTCEVCGTPRQEKGHCCIRGLAKRLDALEEHRKQAEMLEHTPAFQLFRHQCIWGPVTALPIETDQASGNEPSQEPISRPIPKQASIGAIPREDGFALATEIAKKVAHLRTDVARRVLLRAAEVVLRFSEVQSELCVLQELEGPGFDNF